MASQRENYLLKKYCLLQVFTDADFSGDMKDRKLTSEYAFINSGGAVSCRSMEQTICAHSTVWAEYVAMSYAVREVIWLSRIYK